ncbi:MAG TPA: hypothetical protein VFU59_02100 [Candidatus Eisenbacteria bacterium]|nr:hypothetical protein [Candidatus Eisenbacteria bacterium]
MTGRARASFRGAVAPAFAVLALLAPLALLAAAPSPAFAAAERFPRGHALGASAGFPSLLNFEYSYEFGRRAFYLSGGYLGRSTYGVQAGLGLGRNGTARKHSSANLVAGTLSLSMYRDEPETWTYGGFEFHLRYRSVFFTPAFTFGDGTLGDPTYDLTGDESNSDKPPRYRVIFRVGFLAPLRSHSES